MSKKLCKSRERKLCGVCGGLGEYFEIDPTIVRILWIILLFCAGTGFLAYIVLALLMPSAEK